MRSTLKVKHVLESDEVKEAIWLYLHSVNATRPDKSKFNEVNITFNSTAKGPEAFVEFNTEMGD